MPTLRDTEAGGYTSDVDVDQQLLGYLVGGNSLPNISLPNILLSEPHPDSLVGEE